ncbi:hypothetical protein CTRI78_v001263 [Colletotrichum trifolii]|uniref:Uncharacterized protein n=1 Tax=Colletotrichum trifolii TaxID=5466 RepID=A0A4V3HX93_COLTR|nr:hypothetical protein CTRI78_v001263 [Colletotrichum trifolii]
MADTPTTESSSQPLSTPKTMEATNSLALDLEKFEASFKLRMCAVIQELWDSQRELQAFRQRMDVSETEMVETRVKFEGSQNKFARELHDLTSSLNDRLRRLDERQAATTERLDRSDTDVQKLRQEIRQPPIAQQPQSSAAPRNQDDQQPPQGEPVNMLSIFRGLTTFDRIRIRRAANIFNPSFGH